MSVRGTTAWQHAKIGRQIINMDSGDGRHIVCAWDECDRMGLDIYTHIFCEHDPRKGCEQADLDLLAIAGRVAHLKFPFCSHRHMSYYVNAEGANAHESIARTGRAHGNLPVGERTRYG